MKRILLATDFSTISENAFVYASMMAQTLKAEVHVLHVYSLPDIRNQYVGTTTAKVFDTVEQEEGELFDKEVTKLKKLADSLKTSNVDYSYHLRRGEVVPEILRGASETGADLIVMGTKGASGLREIFLGSITGKVINESTGLVLAIPEDARFDGKLDHVAMTTDYKPEDSKAFMAGLHFAQLFDATYHCIHGDLSHGEDYTHLLEKWAGDLSFTYEKVEFTSLDTNNLEEDLLRHAEKVGIDIMCMLSHRRSAFERIFQFSLSKNLLYHGKVPLLIIPGTWFPN